jgi:hypothetical protein
VSSILGGLTDVNDGSDQGVISVAVGLWVGVTVGIDVRVMVGNKVSDCISVNAPFDGIISVLFCGVFCCAFVINAQPDKKMKI